MENNVTKLKYKNKITLKGLKVKKNVLKAIIVKCIILVLEKIGQLKLVSLNINSNLVNLKIHAKVQIIF